MSVCKPDYLRNYLNILMKGYHFAILLLMFKNYFLLT